MSVGYSCPLGSNYWYPLPFSSGDWDAVTNMTFNTTVTKTTGSSASNLRASKTGFTATSTVCFLRTSFSFNASTESDALSIGWFGGSTSVNSTRDVVKFDTTGVNAYKAIIYSGGAVATSTVVLSVSTTYIIEVTISRPSGTTNTIAYIIYASDGTTVIDSGTHTQNNVVTPTAYVGFNSGSSVTQIGISQVWLYGTSVVGTACLGVVPSVSHFFPASTGKLTHASLYVGPRNADAIQSFQTKFKDAV